MVNVAVIGAGGGIGQPLSLLLATQLPQGSTLSLYDLAGVHGVAADISHIDRPIALRAEQGQLPPVPVDPALQRLAKGVDVFVITAGVPRKPGMTRDDLFNINASIALNTIKTAASVSPNAVFCLVTNPVNSIVPIAKSVLVKLGIYNKNKLLGVSQLDVTRATKFVNDLRAPYLTPAQVPVVGGHSDITIVPLFSQVAGPAIPGDVEKLSRRVQDAGTEVVKAKAGKGSATLSMAYAGATFALKVVEGLTGRGTPLAYSYVDTEGMSEQYPEFFAVPLLLGTKGVEQRFPIGPLNDLEKKLLAAAIPAVKKNIAKGEQFAKSKL